MAVILIFRFGAVIELNGIETKAGFPRDAFGSDGGGIGLFVPYPYWLPTVMACTSAEDRFR